jgi:Flp pilus assembly pilin Flp
MDLSEQTRFSWVYFLQEDTGASLIEYALVAMLVAVAASLALLALKK